MEPHLGLSIAKVAAMTRRAFIARVAEEQWMVDAGFRPPCVGALIVISSRQPVSQREVSERLGVDPGDVVKVMDVLEGGGFVERTRDPDDRRRYALRLTPAGGRAVARLRELSVATEDEVLAALTSEERATLGALLAKAADGVLTPS